MIDFVIHRINTIAQLEQIPSHYGVEIDLRAEGSRIILQHDAFKKGEYLDEYLASYNHRLIAVNIKEAGIEDTVIHLMQQHSIKNFFLFDVEFPYIYRASRQSNPNMAIRYSEEESIQTALHYIHKIDWIWIDTMTQLPIHNQETVQLLQSFKSCLVCPDRWGRAQDIPAYATQLKTLQFSPTAIMTSLECVTQWQKFLN